MRIRTGLFERHNMSGRAVEAMQPFGFSVRPEIQIDFEINGNTYSDRQGFRPESVGPPDYGERHIRGSGRGRAAG